MSPGKEFVPPDNNPGEIVPRNQSGMPLATERLIRVYQKKRSEDHDQHERGEKDANAEKGGND